MMKYFCIQHGFRLLSTAPSLQTVPWASDSVAVTLDSLLWARISSDSKSHDFFRMPSTFVRSIHLQRRFLLWRPPHLTVGLPQFLMHPLYPSPLPLLQFIPLKYRLTGLQEFLSFHSPSSKLSALKLELSSSKIPQSSFPSIAPLSGVQRPESSCLLSTPLPQAAAGQGVLLDLLFLSKSCLSFQLNSNATSSIKSPYIPVHKDFLSVNFSSSLSLQT